MSNVKIVLNDNLEKEILKAALDGIEKNGIDISCPNCQKEIHVSSGDSCPFCGITINFGADPNV